jgi:PAS domain S-box-containing protein
MFRVNDATLEGLLRGAGKKILWTGFAVFFPLLGPAHAWGMGSSASTDFMPHGYCYLWDPLVLWLNVISDALITLAYYCIPVVLIYFARKNRELPFNRVFWMFGTFILACGTTHLMEVWNIWHANYLLAGSLKAVTAAVSVLTAAMIAPLLPNAITLPGTIDLIETNRRLEQEIAKRKDFYTATEDPFRRRVKVGFLVAVLVTLLAGVSAWRSAARAEEDEYWVSHTHEVMETIQRAARDLIQTVTSARAFGLSGEEPLLAHYQTAREDIFRDVDRLRHLTADNSSQQQRVDRLEQQMRQAADFSDGLIVQRHKLRATTKNSDVLESERLMDVVRATSHDVFQEELRLMAQRTERAKDGQRLTRIIAVGGALLGIILWFLARLVVNREIEINARGRAQINALNAELEARVIERTKEIESINASWEKEIVARIAEERSRLGTEQRLAAIVDSSEDAIVSKDLTGTIVSWNKGAEKLYGYAAKEIIGKPAMLLIPPALRDEEKFLLGEIAAGRRVLRDDTTRVRKDGHLIQVAVAVSPVIGEQGEIIGAASISHDISERIAMEAAVRSSQQRLESILDSAMDAIVTVDERQQVALFNAAAEKMFLCPARDALGQPLERFIPERFRKAHGAHIERFSETGITSRMMGSMGAIWGVRADGEEFPIEASISQVEAEGKKLFTVILRDITERKRIDGRLREQARVLDLSTVLVRDMDGRISLWTKGAEQLYGYSAADAIGRISHELFQTKFSVALQEMEEKLADGGRWEGELEHRKKDGSVVFVESVQIVYRDEQGHAIRVLEANTDITRRKQDEARLANQAEELSRQANDLLDTQKALQEQTRIFQSVMDGMGEGLVAADEKGKFLLWNRAAEKMLGLGPAAIPPQDWASHYGAYLPDGSTLLPLNQNPLARAIAGEKCDVELLMRPPGSGKTMWMDVAAHPLQDAAGASKGGVAVLRDTTQRKNDEREIRKLNEALEQRVLERTAELQAANKELEAFTYSVSHDLRAPLRHINGFTRILVEDFGPSMPGEARRHLERIEQGATRMGRLVDELLNLTRVGRQALTMQVAGLGSIVKDVIAMLESEMEGRKVEWQIAELPFVECDPTLIRQVFQNLISNALKYSRPRPITVIEIGQMEKDGSTTIFVRDNGVGFSMKYADKLFGVFQRLHRAEDFEGTGVGLATVHRILQKHGGRIWAEAELDRGATFYFTLSGLGQPAKAALGAALGGRT